MENRCVILLMRPDPYHGELNVIGNIVWIPVIKLVPREGCSVEVVRTIKYYNLVTITSPRTFSILLEDARKHNVVEELLKSFRQVEVATIGPITANSLMKHDIRPIIIPNVHNSKHLGREIARRAGNRKVLIIRSAQGVRDLVVELSRAGIDYKEIHVYDVEIDWNAALKAAELIIEGVVDYAVFTSSSIAKAVCRYLRSRKYKPTFIAIGETTKRSIREYCDTDEILVPATSTLRGIAELLSRYCRRKSNVNVL